MMEAKGPGEPLPEGIQEGMKELMGADVSDVKAVYNAPSEDFGAHAHGLGDTICFSQGADPLMVAQDEKHQEVEKDLMAQRLQDYK